MYLKKNDVVYLTNKTLLYVYFLCVYVSSGAGVFVFSNNKIIAQFFYLYFFDMYSIFIIFPVFCFFFYITLFIIIITSLLSSHTQHFSTDFDQLVAISACPRLERFNIHVQCLLSIFFCLTIQLFDYYIHSQAFNFFFVLV